MLVEVGCSALFCCVPKKFYGRTMQKRMTEVFVLKMSFRYCIFLSVQGYPHPRVPVRLYEIGVDFFLLIIKIINLGFFLLFTCFFLLFFCNWSSPFIFRIPNLSCNACGYFLLNQLAPFNIHLRLVTNTALLSMKKNWFNQNLFEH